MKSFIINFVVGGIIAAAIILGAWWVIFQFFGAAFGVEGIVFK